MKPISDYQHVVWDWNGTLFDDTWLCVDVMNGVLSRRGLAALSEERYRKIFDFPVRDYYVRLVGLQDHYAHSKSDNGVRWIEELSHEPHDVLMIGDTVHDYDVATAMGVDCILLAGGHQSETRLRRCPVPVVDSLADLQSRI